MNHRSVLLTAGILGASGVALGASGAHGLLHDLLAERGMGNTWETAVRYHELHAVALVGLAAWLRTATGVASRRAGWAARCWVAGVVMFSGSLYGLSLGGPRWLGPVTPLGGVALLAGWGCLAWSALSHED